MQPTLGQNIRQARKAYGMNQTVLAERIGISKTSLSLIESGDTKDPHYSIVRRIAQVLRLRVDDLDPLTARADAEAPMAHALDLALRYGQIDGAHHKTWVIDQMVRALLQTPEAYAAWVANACAGDEGPETYGWDVGIAP